MKMEARSAVARAGGGGQQPGQWWLGLAAADSS